MRFDPSPMSPDDSPSLPFLSRMLPRRVSIPDAQRRVACEPEGQTWTCARCGAVANNISDAARHLAQHRLQDRPQPRGGRCASGGGRGGRPRSAIQPPRTVSVAVLETAQTTNVIQAVAVCGCSCAPSANASRRA